jgi:iron complex outermembrane recepter protein
MNRSTGCTAARATLGMASSALAIFVSSTAQAQEAASRGLEEVVVTAQKRSESLQDVPLSIVALSAGQLDDRGISAVNSLMGGQVPSVKVQPFAGNPTILEVAMRGFVNPNGTDVTNENPVPIYIDDVYYGRMTSMTMELADIERMEVLRGPQGTLFGKNAAGGTIRIVSKEPTGEFGLRQKIEAGNYNYWKSVTHLDLPSVANIAAKVDLVATDRDGWAENSPASQEDYGRIKSLAGGVTLLWKPTDALSFNYGYDKTDLETTEIFNQVLIAADLYNPWPVQSERADDVPFPTFRPLDQQNFEGHRLTINWDITDSVALKSISAYREDEATLYNTAQSASALPGAFFGRPSIPYATGIIPIYDQDHRQFSQEFQLVGGSEKFNWVAGLYYLEESASQTNTTYLGTVFPNAVTAGPPTFFPLNLGQAVAIENEADLILLAPTTGASVDSTSYAAFAQATWRPGWMSDKLSFTAGARVGHDEKEAVRPIGQIYQSVPWPTKVPQPAFETCPCAPRKVSDDQVDPMATIAYDWTDSINTYLRYSSGYLAPNLSVGSQIFEYNQAGSVDSYELGLKSELADRTLRLNVAAFWLEWKDQHAGIQTTSTSTVEFYNIPKLEVSGVELDATWVPADAFSLSVSLSYLDGTKTEGGVPADFIDPTGAGVQTADNIVALPELTASVAVDWDVATFDWGKLRLNADANYSDEYWTVPKVGVPADSSTLVNARLALADVQALGGILEFAVWGRNLTDESHKTFVYAGPGVTAANTFSAFGDPRMYGASLTLRY